MTYTVSPILVEWDEQKNHQNYGKHGIRFETASLVFADENRIEYYDEIHSTEEDRYIVIGLVNNVLFVVYTMREDTIRIISTRLATKIERNIYYGN